MARSLKPATLDDVMAVQRGTELLREARDLFVKAGACRTVDRVRLAITSAGGAGRHVRRRKWETDNHSG